MRPSKPASSIAAGSCGSTTATCEPGAGAGDAEQHPGQSGARDHQLGIIGHDQRMAVGYFGVQPDQIAGAGRASAGSRHSRKLGGAMPLNPQLDTLSDYPFEALRTLLNPVTPGRQRRADPDVVGRAAASAAAAAGRDARGPRARVEQISADAGDAGIARRDRRLADAALPPRRRRAVARPPCPRRSPAPRRGSICCRASSCRAARPASARSCWCPTRITSSITARRRWPGPRRCFSTRRARTALCPISPRSRARCSNAPRCSICARRPTRRARSPASTI